VVLSCFFSSFYYAYIAAFLDNLNQDGMDLLQYLEKITMLTFIFDLIISFFVDYPYPNSEEVEKSFLKLASMYLRKGFIIDLIPIIPFYIIINLTFVDVKYARLAYLLKLLRLPKGIELINT